MKKYLRKPIIFISLFLLIILMITYLVVRHLMKESRRVEDLDEVWTFLRYDPDTFDITTLGEYEVSIKRDTKRDEVAQDYYVTASDDHAYIDGQKIELIATIGRSDDYYIEFGRLFSYVYIKEKETGIAYVGYSPLLPQYDNRTPESLFLRVTSQTKFRFQSTKAIY